MKISLYDYVKHSVDSSKVQMSLLFRSFNKSIFLSNCKALLQQRKLSLSQVSKIFFKINEIYKQAFIERGSGRKQGGAVTCFTKDSITEDQLLAIDYLII